MTLVDVNPTILEDYKICLHVDHGENILHDSYILELLHDSSEIYYKGGTYACRIFNHIKFPLYVFKVLKLCLFCLPMLVDSYSHNFFLT